MTEERAHPAQAKRPKEAADALGLSQLDKFKAAARELGTDDDPERFKERVKRVANAPPSPGASKTNFPKGTTR